MRLGLGYYQHLNGLEFGLLSVRLRVDIMVKVKLIIRVMVRVLVFDRRVRLIMVTVELLSRLRLRLL